jgi:hypothetical protein
MYIIVLDGREEEGAYSVSDEVGDNVLYIFEEEDDALRFCMMLNELGYPKMNAMEVETDVIIAACEMNDYKYNIFTADDIVVPPEEFSNSELI